MIAPPRTSHVNEPDDDCAGTDISADQACTGGRGYCFNSECCCDDAQYDNDNQCQDLDECESSPCQNGRRMSRIKNGYYECDCLTSRFMNLLWTKYYTVNK